VKNVGNPQRDDRAEEDPLTPRGISPLDDQRLRYAEKQGDDGRSQRIDDRVDERREEETLGEEALVILQREFAQRSVRIAHMQTDIDKEPRRRNDQKRENDRQRQNERRESNTPQSRRGLRREIRTRCLETHCALLRALSDRRQRKRS